MQVQEVQVTIRADGQVELAVQGVPGGACLELTAALEAALGNQVTSRNMTSEAEAMAPPGVISSSQQVDQRHR